MAQYVDPRNQEMLWKTFHRIPEVTHLAYPVRESVFKEAVSQVYHGIAPNMSHFSMEELQELNKQTLSILIQKVRREVPQPSFDPPPRPEVPKMVESAVKKTGVTPNFPFFS